MLPGIDGYSLVTNVRRQLHTCVPAVAVTTLASSGERAQILAHGFQAHFPKPLDLERLAAAIRELRRGG